MASRARTIGPAGIERRGTGAPDLLRAGHRSIRDLFDEFERTEEPAAKRRLVEKALIALTIHAKLEEELFYPAARRGIGDHQLMDEAAEEHHVVDLLVAELASMKSTDPRYEAKFLVLAQNVRNHVDQEEQDMLPRIEAQGDVDLESLGQEMAERKKTLEEEVSLDSIRGEAWPVPGETPRGPSTVRSRGRRRARGRARQKTTGRS